MNITSAKYQKNLENTTVGINATIDDVQIFVPISEENRHYIAIQKWVSEDGGEIQAAE